MGKKYTEDLAEWVEKRAEKKRRQDTAAVAFMAVKAHVIEALDAGYAMTTIWEHMHETGKLKCSYETFRKHVQRFIATKRPSHTEPDKGTIKPRNVTKADPREAPNRPKLEAPSMGGFTFEATPKKEDLI